MLQLALVVLIFAASTALNFQPLPTTRRQQQHSFFAQRRGNDNGGSIARFAPRGAPRQQQHSSLHSTTTTSGNPLQVRVEKFARLPVWPVQNGIIRFFLSRLSEKAGVAAEKFLGGSVCPNFFDPNLTNPFILLVHHNHKFLPFDPIRPLSALLLPEGFPAHPHRGFITLTIVLKGGINHRDSIGVKQSYGRLEKHEKFAQYLKTGSGMLHEEMWDIDGDGGVDQELYQVSGVCERSC